jgi:hypothetical protein
LVDKGGGRELHGGFMVADFVYNWLTIKEHDV